MDRDPGRRGGRHGARVPALEPAQQRRRAAGGGPLEPRERGRGPGAERVVDDLVEEEEQQDRRERRRPPSRGAPSGRARDSARSSRAAARTAGRREADAPLVIGPPRARARGLRPRRPRAPRPPRDRSRRAVRARAATRSRPRTIVRRRSASSSRRSASRHSASGVSRSWRISGTTASCATMLTSEIHGTRTSALPIAKLERRRRDRRRPAACRRARPRGSRCPRRRTRDPPMPARRWVPGPARRTPGLRGSRIEVRFQAGSDARRTPRRPAAREAMPPRRASGASAGAPRTAGFRAEGPGEARSSGAVPARSPAPPERRPRPGDPCTPRPRRNVRRWPSRRETASGCGARARR